MTETRSHSRLGATASVIRESARQAAAPARLLLVAKTALAVAVAWLVAPHMPGVVNDYPYYAPLGALISMYPTLMGSVRSGLQTIFGLAAGIGLATLVIVTVGPNWWSIPVVVGLAVLVSGTGWFGAGREYVSMAALFVLIIGGQNAEDYSLGYLVQMAVGVTIGLLVNVLVAPAPLTAQAAARVDAFRTQLSAHLHDIGDAISASWPPERDHWAEDSVSLADTTREIRGALAEADDSRRGNPRARFARDQPRDVWAEMDALDTIAHHIRDISGTIADTIWDRPAAIELDPALPRPLTAACHAVADALPVGTDDSPKAHRLRAEAARAVRQLLETVDDRTFQQRRSMGPGVLTAMHLRRILLLARPVPEPDEA
jgi:uncharacterized membrane protein YccC